MNAPSLLQHAITPPLPTLPTEVIEEVIDQASDDRLSLRDLSLLCKTLLTRSRFHLFTGIVIRNVEQMNSSREFLDSHPWIHPLIKKVTLSIEIDDDYPKAHIPLLDIIRSHLLFRLPNMHTWRMSTTIPKWSELRAQLSFHPSTLLCYRTHGRHIQTLELASIRIPDISHFIRLVSAFTSLRSLTCSDILVRKELQAPLLDLELIRKLSKPLKTKLEHLAVDTTVDIRLVEYLLRASVATVNSFAMTISDDTPRTEQAQTYFERLEEWMDQFNSMLSSLSLVIMFDRRFPWFNHDHSESLIQHIRWATKILQHFKGRKCLRDVRIQFELPSISTLGGPLSRGGSSLEACTALEELLLAFPTSDVQFQCNWHRAGRAEFWSPVIKSAFLRLNERRRLTLPKTSTSSVDLLGHDDFVTSVVASPNSKWIMTGSADGTIIIWNAEGGTIMHEWLAHWGRVEDLSFSPDSRQLVSAGGESGETLIIWDLNDSGVRNLAALAYVDQKGSIEKAVFTCSWSPDGKLVASSSRTGPVHIWDALTFQQRNQLPVSASNQHAIQLRSISLHWTSDSHYLVWTYITSKGDGAHYDEWAIWSPHIAEPPKVFPSHPTHHFNFNIMEISLDPENRRIATALEYTALNSVGGGSEGASGVAGTLDGHSGCVLIRDIASGTKLAVLGHDSMRVEDISFSLDGRSFLSIDEHNLKIWDTDSWQLTASLEEDGGLCRKAHFSPDGKYVAATSNNYATNIYRVLLWKVGETSCTAVLTDHKSEINDLAFSPNGEFLASGDGNGLVHIYHLSDFTGK